jgi:phosphoenolpyruvate carboxykinase (GTP)
MANLDFLVVPLGRYIQNHINFGNDLANKPLVFATNYFIKEDGKFLNEKLDKKIWLLWMEGRIHSEYEAIETPVGYIPKYEDLKELFKQVFAREYTKEEYDKQFAVRIGKFIEKLDRMEKVYAEEDDIPQEFTGKLAELKERFMAAQEKYGTDVILPEKFI